MIEEQISEGGVWLRTDEQHDVLISLTEVLHQIKRVGSGELHCWKWAIIAMTSAINGALTCNLSGTMQVGALEQHDRDQTVAALQKDSSTEMPRNPRLAPPAILLKRARRRDKRIEGGAGRTLCISPRQSHAFKRLFSFRNVFVHFKPMGWSIEISGMAAILEEVLGIFDQTLEDNWSFRHLDGHDRAQLEQVRNDLRCALAKLAGSPA